MVVCSAEWISSPLQKCRPTRTWSADQIGAAPDDALARREQAALVVAVLDSFLQLLSKMGNVGRYLHGT